MKLALIGTGKIIADALVALQPVGAIERRAIFARPHSRAKGAAGSTIDVTPFDGELPARVAKALPRLARQLPT